MRKNGLIVLNFLILVRLSLVSTYMYAQPIGYSYGREIEIQSSMISGGSPHIDFPFLVNITDTLLRHTANGGHIEHISGYDIIFTLDDFTELDHETEKYDPTTGELITWIRIPSLDPSVDQSIYMYYGNSSISSDPSTSDVWNANFLRTLHLETTDDATGYASHGTNNGASIITGKIGNGHLFESSNRDYIQTSNTTHASFTISCWLNANTLGVSTGSNAYSGSGIIWSDWGGCADDMIPMALNNNNLIFGDGQRTPCQYDNLNANTTVSTGSWYYIVVTRDSVSKVKQIYINGSLDNTTTSSNTSEPDRNPNIMIGGNTLDHRYFDGIIDEVRFSDVVKSADWITTEYNNQNNTSSFSIVSEELSSGDLTLLPIELLYFNVSLSENNNVLLQWETVSEINHHYFTIERSIDGIKWEEIAKINRSENISQEVKYYSYKDTVLPNTSKLYYQLKQTDFDGATTYSPVKYINVDEGRLQIRRITVYPNPNNGYITVVGPEGELESITILDVFGQDVTHYSAIHKTDNSTLNIDLSKISMGVLFIKTKSSNYYKIQKL